MTDSNKIVDVLLPIALDRPLSYALKDHINVTVGDFVEVPLGRKTTLGVVWPSEQTPTSLEGSKIKAILGKSTLPPLPQTHIQFLQRLSAYTLTPLGMALRATIQAGLAERSEKTQLIVSWHGEIPKRLSDARKRVLETLSDGKTLLRSDLAKEAGVSLATINTLIDEGILFAHAQTKALPGTLQNQNFPTKPPLNAAQTQALRAIKDTSNPNSFCVNVLKGITGSGKTEVYIELILQALKNNQQVIVLLPEIALTSELTLRFEQRLGLAPALWHNKQTPAQRARIWHGVHAGEIKLIVGARSALFLPIPNLGLIVVDEEHDNSFKQDEGIHYQGRDMAVLRAQCTPCPIVLVSATPSLETQVNVDKGRYHMCELNERAQNSTLPDIHIIDLRNHKLISQTYLTEPLLDALTQNLKQKKQSLLYLNRRGFAPLTLCKTCGHKFGCPNCSTWLVTHIGRHALVCHHCGHTQKIPQHCPSCLEENTISHVGPGIEKLYDEVKTHFPQARVLALSSDMPGGAARINDELERIKAGEVDIIIGTQIVAKGHNFPALTLVGVVDADAGLGGLDPRAMERTFQTLTQVTGRAGRGQTKGVAYIQTYEPKNPVIVALQNQNEAEFYTREKQLREQAKMPPFGKMASVVVSANTLPQAQDYARSMLKCAPAMAGVRLLGPAEATILRIRGRYRLRFFLRADLNANLQGYLRHWQTLWPKAPTDIKVALDIDPYNFL